MLALPRRSFTTAAIALGLLALFPAAGAQTRVDDTALAGALRAGGHIILMRHGATNPDQEDADPLNFDNIAGQRQLSDSGKALAKAFGEALRDAGVPIGKVYTSKYHRAYETATLAGFTDVEKTPDLTYGGHFLRPGEDGRRTEALRAMLATPPKPGTNTLMVTHKPNILHVLGDDWGDVKEGEALIFHPENGKFVLVARVQMADWPRIAVATH